MITDREPMRAYTTLLAALLLAAPLRAQEGTDFSGHWVLESSGHPGVDVPTALTIEQSVARTNVFGEPMKPFFKDLTVIREFTDGRRRSETYLIGVIGGTVPGGSVGGGGSKEPYTHVALRWEGRALIIETGSHTGPQPETGEWVERQEMWSVDSKGKLHIVIRTRSSTEAPTQVALTYRRMRRPRRLRRNGNDPPAD